MESKAKAVRDLLIIFAVCIPVVIVGVPYGIMIFAQLWEWFMVPWIGVRLPDSYAHIFGLLSTFAFLVRHLANKSDTGTLEGKLAKEKDAEKIVSRTISKVVAMCIIGPTVTLVFGWIAHRLM